MPFAGKIGHDIGCLCSPAVTSKRASRAERPERASRADWASRATLVTKRRLDFGTASEDATIVAMLPPVGERGNGRSQPEQSAGEVDPDGMLHALDVAVAVGILVNVQLAKNAEESDPQNEENCIPGRNNQGADVNDEWNEVKGTCGCRQGANHDGIDPFGAGILVEMHRTLQVGAVKATDGEGKRKADKVKRREGVIANGKVDASHGAGCSLLGDLRFWVIRLRNRGLNPSKGEEEESRARIEDLDPRGF